jgi:hypothetical protein
MRSSPALPRLIPDLVDEAYGLDKAAGRLWVAQLWTGFSHSRGVFARNLNDERTDRWPGSVAAMKSRFVESAAMLLPTRCTNAQARDWLASTGRPRERRCIACDHLLPLGFLFCTSCGLPGGGQADITKAACAGGGSCHPTTL